MERKGSSLREKLHLLLLIVFIILVYYGMVFESIFINKTEDNPSFILILFLHFFLFLLVWSMSTTILVDPGKTELFWVC
jgi:hypothetical protein